MQNLENILKTRIRNNKAGTFVVLVPTRSARLKRQRELISYHPNKAVANLTVHTLETFAQKLYEQLRPDARRTRISSALQTYWLRELVNQPAGERFQPMKGGKVPDCTLAFIVNTINYLNERGPAYTERARNSSNTPIAESFFQLYEAYQRKIGTKWRDDAGIHQLLVAPFQHRLMRKAFPLTTLVVVEDFDVLSKAAVTLLKKIAEMPDVKVCIRSEYYYQNATLFGHIQKLFDELSGPNITVSELAPEKSARNLHFAHNLFRTTESEQERWNAEEQIKLVKPFDRLHEVELTAQLIRQRVATGACKLNDICVTYRDFRHYLQCIAEVFPEHGIPYSVSEGMPLAQSPVVRAIFYQLETNTLPLASPYFSNHELPSISQTDEKGMTPEAFKTHFDSLLIQGNVLRHILKLSADSRWQTQTATIAEIHAYQELNARVSELCSSLEEETRPYRDYIERLKLIVRYTTYQIPETSAGVHILRLSQLRSLEFDTVIVGDFIDGKFPEHFHPKTLLPQPYARNKTEMLSQSRFLFYTMLKSFQKRLYLMCPKHGNETLLLPSPFLAELERIAKIDTEKVENTGQFSQSRFLRKYGQYVWDCAESEAGYRSEVTEMSQTLQERCSLVAHVATVEKSREKTHEHLDYEGILTGGLSRESESQLEKRRDNHYAVTTLETYGRCPFQFFADDILALREKEDTLEEDDLSALEKGNLVHQILFKFYHNRQESPPLAQCSPAEIAEAQAQLYQLIAEQIRDTKPDNLFREIDEALLKNALRKWFEAEQKSDVNIVSHIFEVNTDTESIQVNGVQLKARIDRIDVAGDVFNVIDYKTGNLSPKISGILEGRALQLPLYLKIASRLLKGQYVPTAGLYHKIKFDECKVELGIGKEKYNGRTYKTYNGTAWKKSTKANKQMVSDEKFDAIIKRVSRYIRQYVDSIGKGVFPLITRVETFVNSEEDGDTPITPRNLTAPCRYCSYKQMCRVGAISEGNSLTMPSL